MSTSSKKLRDREFQRHKRHQKKFEKRRRLQKPELAPLPDVVDKGEILDANWHFIESLHGAAREPTPSDIVQEHAYALADLNKPDAFAKACSLLSSQLKYDISIVRNHCELLTALENTFQPIFIPQDASLAPTHSWSIAKQVASMGLGDGHAFLPAKEPGTGGTTHEVSMDDVRRTMLDNPKPLPMNMLDVCNRSSHTFNPAAVAEVDLIVLIKSRYDDGTWTRSNDQQIMPYDWMLLTAGPVASHFHADQAGYCTAVIGLQGEKWWYVPNGDWEMNRKAFYLSGQAFVNYTNGISVVVIGEGDCLYGLREHDAWYIPLIRCSIQGPGTPHAVITQGKSLAAGCFFYTAAFFARSIQCVGLYFEGRLDDNEAISVRDYANLSLVVEHLDRDIFTAAQRDAVFVEVGFLLLSQQRIARDASNNMTRTRAKRGKKGDKTAQQVPPSTTETLAAKDRFIEKCLEWYLREQKRRLPDIAA